MRKRNAAQYPERRSMFEAPTFFVMRTPLMPWETLQVWSDGLSAPGAPPDGLDQAVEADARLLTERLRTLMADPVVREAIFIASPTFDDAVRAWFEDPTSARAQRVEDILTRYLARMAGRPTPFGIFSGCSTGSVGAKTDLSLASRDRYRRDARVDMHLLTTAARSIERDPAIRQELLFRPNDAIVQIDGWLRYPEARVDEAGHQTFHLVAVEHTEPLGLVLESARSGATIENICDALGNDLAERDDLRAFVEEIIEAQLIVSDLGPLLTGTTALDSLVSILEKRAATSPIARTLGAISAALSALNDAKLGQPIARYGEIAASLRTLPVQSNRG